ncbi:histone-lysine N-methyltransferase (Ash1), putative [Talaromyces stipitatus ATCC 10500]|uniref:Histone-lysine N-methyltransferase (Ash1), putative n=1 Tax=Talaromyces stipitatus (strain ATCC 10500 / CBS 375.48 / QM 6759 / NRRL 1006) TaxID=441959 RepID=B8MLM8_TALSN|nr:histone-lysine N-methyltransferase (Ash1), putative [Talaromyces stipitatus ATCC 10500]EED13891.1 histone-lysine N-methyltransferase (Ash1), putative [Talaromyces stipitatus ATCC 10500]
MFESIVNFLSPAALSNSILREAVAAAPDSSKMMTRRAHSSLESAAAVVAATATTITTDTMEHDAFNNNGPVGVDFSGPLLTPEASRSETSSNHDLVAGDEKPQPRRRSARVTRLSLRALENLRDLEEENKSKQAGRSPTRPKDRTVSGETLINSIADSRASPSSPKNDTNHDHSWSQTTLLRDGPDTNEHAHLATPVSKRSEEEEVPRRRSLRARPAKEDDPNAKENKEDNMEVNISINKREKATPPRRSSRLSMVTRAAEVLDRAASVLGKRSRDAMEKAVMQRRASLRPRHSLPAKDSLANSELPDHKKRRVSDSDLQAKKTELDSAEKPDTDKIAPVAPQFKPKRWLDQGMYTGQERDYDPRLNEANNKIRAAKRRAAPEPQRKLLPLPMFAGERLLKVGRDFKLPFDIFSPLPPGQPKPDEWKKVNRNVFVGDAASFWRENKKIELSTCLCSEETGCDEDCQNRFMFYECDSSNCRVGPNCGNRSFEELKQRTKAGGKYNVGVEVIKTADRGYGVRSNRTFEPNQVIVEYTGEIITQSECERRMRTVYKNNECYYLMYFDQNMIIDATRGSIARFVNHSCAPNCRMEKWTVGGKPRMALFAGDRGIMTGEELTYDYNFDPYSQKNVQQCRCGAPTCRGVLGPRPKGREIRESKAEQKKVALQKKAKSTLVGTKRKLGNVLDESTTALNKKRKTLAGTSVRTISKVVSKAKSALNSKKAPVQVKKNVTVTKTTKPSAKSTTKTKTISKSRVTKVATAAKATKATSKVKNQQVTKKHTTKSASKQPTKETNAVSKPLSASEKVRIRFKATARRSTSFKKGTQTLKAKSPAKKTPLKKTPSKKTPIKTPSGSVKSRAALTKVGK